MLVAVAALAAAGVSSARTNAAARPQVHVVHAASLKIGLVTDIGGLNDKSFNHLAYLGLQQAKTQLGVTVSVLQSHSQADYVPNLSKFAAQKYDLIIGVGFLMENAMGSVAKKFPTTHFAIIDDSYASKGIAKAKNVQGLLFHEEQSGYLAGYLSGLMEKSSNKHNNSQNVVSTVGGVKIPPVDHYIAGFIAGVKKADPGVKELNAYSNSFTDAAACKSKAQAQLSQGSDVVFQVAGGCGLGALDAAKAKGVWGIGVDADQGYLGSYILCSAIKKVDQAVFLTVKALKAGKFAGGTDTTFGVKQGGAGIAGINPAVPASIKAKVTAVQTRIAAGKIKIPNTV